MRHLAPAQGIEAARWAWFDELEWFAVTRARRHECRAEAEREMIADFAKRPRFEPGASAPAEVSNALFGSIHLPVLLLNGAHELADFYQQQIISSACCRASCGAQWPLPAAFRAGSFRIA